MDNTTIKTLLKTTVTDSKLNSIYNKVVNEERITPKEGTYLFYNAELSHLGTLANYIREKRHGNKTYFNKNFHIEPTNICVFDCKFCSYSRFLREKDEYDAWELSEEDIYNAIRNYDGKDITEVHIVGGVHPKMGLALSLIHI